MSEPSKISHEIRRRIALYYDHSHVFGLEVRSRRYDLEMTLYNLSHDICSMSYLCKVENNKIIPNEYCVGEICNKLEIDHKTLQAINDVEKNLLKLVNAYLNEEMNIIEDIYKESRQLKSYASDIISFVYYISISNIEKTTEYFNKVNNLVSSMSDNELLIVSIFESIYFYLNQDFKSSLKLLDYVDKFCFEKDILILSKFYRYYNLIAMNSPMVGSMYDEIILYLINHNKYSLCEKINYAMAISILRGNDFNSFVPFKEKINNNKYLANLKILECIIKDDIKSLKEFEKYNDASLYYQNLRNIYLKEGNNDYSLTVYKVDEYPLLQDFLSIEDDYDKMDFLSNIAIPSLSIFREKFLIDYFIKNLARLSLKKLKYKSLASSIYKLEEGFDDQN